jgi:hypothetical protein
MCEMVASMYATVETLWQTSHKYVLKYGFGGTTEGLKYGEPQYGNI